MLSKAKVVKSPYQTNKKGHYIDVIKIPNFLRLDRVELPRVLNNQVQPDVGDIVLVWNPDPFTRIFVSKLKDKEESLKGSLRSEVKGGKNFFKPGEIHYESMGGAYHYISNSGEHHLIAGGTNDAKLRLQPENNTVMAEGSNIDFRTIGNCRFRMYSIKEEGDTDYDHNIVLQNYNWSGGPTEEEPNIKSQIQLDNDGNILLETRNPKSILIDPLGGGKQRAVINVKENRTIEIKANDSSGNEKSKILIEGDGNVSIEVAGKVVINSDNIELGQNASKSVARVGDKNKAHKHQFLGPGGLLTDTITTQGGTYTIQDTVTEIDEGSSKVKVAD